MKKNKKALLKILNIEVTLMGLVIIIGLLIAFVAGINIFRSRAAAEVKLSFNAGNNELVTTKTVKLILDSGSRPVTFARVDFQFDKSKFAIIGDIETSDRFKNVIRKTSSSEASANGKGTLILTVVVEDKNNIPSGTIELATFRIEKKSGVTEENITSDLSFIASTSQVVGDSANQLTLDTPKLTLRINPTATATSEPSTDPGEEQTVTLNPIADTSSVSTQRTDTSYGRRTTLLINGGPRNTAYLKFELSSLGDKPVSKAILRFRASTGSVDTQNMRELSANNWTESTLNYSSRPSLGSTIATNKGGKNGEWKEVDITSYVKTKVGKTMSLGIDQTGGDGFGIYSRESAYKPELIISY